MMTRWRLYYWNGATYSSTEGAPEDTPRDFVLAVTQPALERDKVIANAAYLMWRTDLGRWTRCGEDGLFDHLSLWAPQVTAVRKGIYLPTTEWRAVWADARAELGLK
jgi:hypothetical protein